MIIRVLDLETGGFAPPHGVCEAGYTDVMQVSPGNHMIVRQGEQLFDPEFTMTQGAIQTHGISHEMLVGKPKGKLVSEFLHYGPEISYMAAHNLKFETQWIDFRNIKTICTLICAKEVLPGHRSYKNETLFKALGCDDMIDASMITPAHRARPDTAMTACVLIKMLEKRSAEELHCITHSKPFGKKLMFGKYKGISIDDKDVPTHYLTWCLEQSWLNKETFKIVKDEIDVRKAQN